MTHTYPTWLDKEAWSEYQQHRMEIRKPLTPLAEKKAIKKLQELLAQCAASQQEIIDQSIINGWTGLFPIRNMSNAHQRILKPAAESAANTLGHLYETGYRTGFEEEATDQPAIPQNVFDLRKQMV